MTPRRILIADDDVDALRLVGLMLERKGYQILAAASGQQALQKAIEANPDIIILDVMMPDMDGYQVAAQLRKHPATESIPILMFTAKAAVNDKIAGFQAGADDYLTKPVHPRELITRIEALLQRRGATSDTEARKQGHIVAFLPTKGGLGTTTLTVNTAVEIKNMHKDKKVALVELQEGSGTVGLQLGLDEEAGLPHLLAEPLTYLTRNTLHEQMAQHNTGLQVLTSNANPIGTGDPLSEGFTRTLLRFLGTENDYLVLDLPARLDAPYAEALKVAETIVVSVDPNPIGMELARRMLASLDQLGIGSHRVKLVLIHRVPASGALSRTMIEQTLHREMIGGIPPAADLAYQSARSSKPMVQIQPRGLVAQQVRRVVQSIVEA
jgi:pilus assembly protein CpaE